MARRSDPAAEMFETLGTLPDWIAILLTLVGLFGGAGAGTYYGAVRRARLEDRRELLSTWMPWIRSFFTAPAPGVPGSKQATSEAIRSLFLGLDSINEVVRRLPWKDRALWQGVVELHFRVGDQALVDAYSMHYPQLLSTEPLTDDERREVTELEYSEQLRDAVIEALVDGEWAAFILKTPTQVENMEAHLIRQINPTYLSRFSDFMLTARLLRSGSRSWGVRIQPRRMTLLQQLSISLGTSREVMISDMQWWGMLRYGAESRPPSLQR